MKLYFKYDRMVACNTLVGEQLNKLGLSYELVGPVEVEIKDPVTEDKLKELNTALNRYGIEIVENQKSVLVQKIKDTITEVVYSDGELPVSKISAYLADKLKYNYGYLSNLFSDVTYTSIENFTILQKIERAKQLITTDDLTFTEIAWRLNYSSVAHFSTQFKNATGLTPSAFQRIISKRQNTLPPDK
ncbi:MAG: AraC family transcriptional regulator [Saprospiraceae bacterium]